MKKKAKLAIVGLSATLLCASAIGANFAINNGINYGVNGEDNAKEYTLTLNKDTSDAFKTGWNGDIFTIKTTLGNPIRFKKVTTNTKGVITAGTANTTDALEMPFKEGSTYACLFVLDPIQTIKGITAKYSRIGGSGGPQLRFYQSNEPFTEKSSFEDTTTTNNLINGVNKNWGFDDGKYLALRFYRSGSNDITMALSSLVITYTCA